MSLKIIKYLSLLSAVLIVIAVFLPWITIESLDLTITGMDTTGTRFGKPGVFHLAMAFLFVLLAFIPRIWAKRLNLLVVALNLAWAIRNFIMIPACSGGECPTREIGIIVILVGSVVMLVGALFPDVDLEKIKSK